MACAVVAELPRSVFPVASVLGEVDAVVQKLWPPLLNHGHVLLGPDQDESVECPVQSRPGDCYSVRLVADEVRQGSEERGLLFLEFVRELVEFTDRACSWSPSRCSCSACPTSARRRQSSSAIRSALRKRSSALRCPPSLECCHPALIKADAASGLSGRAAAKQEVVAIRAVHQDRLPGPEPSSMGIKASGSPQ